jgi:glycosyltransferase involved in cell wall biosynthesis
MKVGVSARMLLPGELEGIGRFTFETLSEMARSHPEVEFILFFDRPFDRKYLPYSNMKGVTIYLPTRLPILLWIWLEILLPFFLWIYSIDVLYAPDNFLSLRTNVPTLLVCHDIVYCHYPESINKRWISFYRKYMPKYLDKAFKVASVSQFVKDDLISSLNVDKHKIEVVYNALPNRIVSERKDDFKFGFQYFIYIGSIHPRKNIRNLIDGFKQFSKSSKHNIKLILVGRMAWDTDEITDKMNGSDEIFHLNNVSDDQVYGLIKNSLGLVYVSNFEGFGIPILEGFHCEVPVITSNVASMPEVAGKAALLVDPSNIEEISNAFKAISTDKELSYYLVNEGRKRIKDFNWTKSANQLFSSLKAISEA